MYEQFVFRFKRPPTDHEIGTMPLPPEHFVEDLRTGKLRYGTSSLSEHIRRQFSDEDQRIRALRQKQRSEKFQQAERERLKRKEGQSDALPI